MSKNQEKKTIKVFCCYSHSDEDLLKELKIHLNPLQRQQLISVWHDRDISVGADWEQEIKQHLNEADIILLLMSANFLHSDYCYSVEMVHALQRHERKEATAILVILRPVVAWQDITIGTIPLGRLQVLPKNTKPLTQWDDRDEAWYTVAEGIQNIINKLLKQPSIDQSTFTPESATNIPEKLETFRTDPNAPLETASSVSHPSSNADSNLPTIPVAVSASRRKGRLLMAISILLVVMITALIGGANYVYTYNEHMQTTATARNATATTQARINAYNDYVAHHGIMFGFNAQHTNSNPYEHLLTVNNVSQLRQKWTFATNYYIESSPVVANGIVYIGSDDGRLYALDAVTGQLKWAAHPLIVGQHSNWISSSPAVVNGIVYVGTGIGKLYAFDALTGQQKWASSIGDYTDASPADGMASSPTVADGIVYFGSEDGNLYAFDALTGQQKWMTPTGGPVYSSAAVANGTVYIGSRDNKFYAFDAATGQQKWTVTTGDFVFSSPAIANGTIYFGSRDSKLYALDPATGRQKWTASTGGEIDSSPTVLNGTVYIGSDDDKLYAFDAVTGQEKWNASTKGWISSFPIIANGVVYASSGDHKLYAFDAVTGQQKWVALTGGWVASSPTVANGMVYVGSFDNATVYAFSLQGQ